jgi:hypothetical protein
MVIPGWLVAIATFPGVIVHEAAHMLFCRIRGVAVLDVCFFRVGNPAGYVVHEEAKDFTTSFLISVGPFIVNTVVCLLLCLPAFAPVKLYDVADPLSYLLIWLGVSIGAHAFPSTADAKGLWAHARVAARAYNPLAILSLPLVGLIYVAHILAFFWFDVLYGIAVGIGLPMWLLEQIV